MISCKLTFLLILKTAVNDSVIIVYHHKSWTLTHLVSLGNKKQIYWQKSSSSFFAFTSLKLSGEHWLQKMLLKGQLFKIYDLHFITIFLISLVLHFRNYFVWNITQSFVMKTIQNGTQTIFTAYNFISFVSKLKVLFETVTLWKALYFNIGNK